MIHRYNRWCFYSENQQQRAKNSLNWYTFPPRSTKIDKIEMSFFDRSELLCVCHTSFQMRTENVFKQSDSSLFNRRYSFKWSESPSILSFYNFCIAATVTVHCLLWVLVSLSFEIRGCFILSNIKLIPGVYVYIDFLYSFHLNYWWCIN